MSESKATAAVADSWRAGLETLTRELREAINADWHQDEKLNAVADKLEAVLRAVPEPESAKPSEAEKELALIKKRAKCLRLEDLIGGDDMAKRSETIAALKSMELLAALQIENERLQREARAEGPSDPITVTRNSSWAWGRAVSRARHGDKAVTVQPLIAVGAPFCINCVTSSIFGHGCERCFAWKLAWCARHMRLEVNAMIALDDEGASPAPPESETKP